MARTAEAIITPEVLTWARETVGFSEDDLAAKLKVEVDAVHAWERGSERPSIAKLKQIANILKRPLAVFYLPTKPQDMRPPKDFRGLIPGHAGTFSPQLSVELRLAEARREDALALLEELEEEPSPFEFTATLTDNPETVAEQLISYLEVDQFVINRCNSIYDARKAWKTAIEDKGALVFQANNIDTSEMRGFSFSLAPLPIAVINGKDSVNGQIFSLLHELTHIVLNQGGICDFDEDLPRDDNAQRLEVFCNHVAGAALVPADRLLQHDIVRENKGDTEWDDEQLNDLATHFRCSQEVVLRRLLIHDLTTPVFYARKRAEFIRRYQAMAQERQGQSFPVPYFRKVLNRNGYYFSRLAVDSYKREAITGPELSRLLNMKLTHLENISQALGV
jgi:Zn-dependent peptidase ImmA (M78 family)/DNA-binding XRE family transcriptional regulator